MKNKDIIEWLLNNNINPEIQVIGTDGKQQYLPDILEKHLKEQLTIFQEWYDNLSQEENAWYEGRYAKVFLEIKDSHCSICGSESVEEIRGDWQFTESVLLKDAWYYRCKTCGECFTNMEMSIHNDKRYEETCNIKLREG